MIIKELDPINCETPIEKSGFKAEKQMAFYLKQRFDQSNDFFVLNNIRFAAPNGCFSQIDHLVLSRYGAVIVESKSVTTAVKYGTAGQWFRLWGNHWNGMPSPVQQAKIQGNALRELLRSQRETLRKKIFLGLVQGGFGYMPIDVIVAISDSGKIILPPGKNPYEGVVMKSDLVTDRIVELFETYKRKNSIFSKDAFFSKDAIWDMSQEELRNVSLFLYRIHEPLEKKAKPSEPVQESVPEAPAVSSPQTTAEPVPNSFQNPLKELGGNPVCPECSDTMKILWGNRFKNYYWHCEKCGKNVSINLKCPVCGSQLRLRKQKNEYFIYCEPCGISGLYFTEN
ncbi:MAG: NERD domain-containing protein [Thermoguttaceae bacterium]